MKKILITRKLIRESEDKATKTFDPIFNSNDELYSQSKVIEMSKGCDGILSSLTDKLDQETINDIRANANFENLTKLVNAEYGTNMTSEEYANIWQNATIDGSTSNWGDVTAGVDLLSQVGSFEAASIAKDLGTDLQTVADSIALAATVGVSTDLEAAASGLGYDSFADAVSALSLIHI